MRIGWAAMISLNLLGCGGDGAQDPEAERDRKLEEMLSNVSLIGQSTSFDQEGITGEEEYVIEKISRIAGDRWLFQTRMKLGYREVPVPIPITILWAGDTPVITLTDLSIPGVGTYSARVVLYRDHYAGTWLGEDRGGHVFGRIVRREND